MHKLNVKSTIVLHISYDKIARGESGTNALKSEISHEELSGVTVVTKNTKVVVVKVCDCCN